MTKAKKRELLKEIKFKPEKVFNSDGVEILMVEEIKTSSPWGNSIKRVFYAELRENPALGLKMNIALKAKFSYSDEAFELLKNTSQSELLKILK